MRARLRHALRRCAAPPPGPRARAFSATAAPRAELNSGRADPRPAHVLNSEAQLEAALAAVEEFGRLTPPKVTLEHVNTALANWDVLLAGGAGQGFGDGDNAEQRVRQQETSLGALRVLRLLVSYTQWQLPHVTWPAEPLFGPEAKDHTLCLLFPSADALQQFADSIESRHMRQELLEKRQVTQGFWALLYMLDPQSTRPELRKLAGVVFNPLQGDAPGQQVVVMRNDLQRLYEFARAVVWERALFHYTMHLSEPGADVIPPTELLESLANGLCCHARFYLVKSTEGDSNYHCDAEGAAIVGSSPDVGIELQLSFPEAELMVVEPEELLRLALEHDQALTFTLLGGQLTDDVPPRREYVLQTLPPQLLAELDKVYKMKMKEVGA